MRCSDNEQVIYVAYTHHPSHTHTLETGNQAERIAKKIALTVTGTLRQFKNRSNSEIDTNISVCLLLCLNLRHTHAMLSYASHVCIFLNSRRIDNYVGDIIGH